MIENGPRKKRTRNEETHFESRFLRKASCPISALRREYAITSYDLKYLLLFTVFRTVGRFSMRPAMPCRRELLHGKSAARAQP